MSESFDERVYAAWVASAFAPHSVSEKWGSFVAERGSYQACHAAFFAGHEDCPTLPDSMRRRLQSTGQESYLRFFQALLNAHAIQLLSLWSKTYPDTFDPRNPAHLDDPPLALFYQGNPECLRAPRRLAMVGSRRVSYEGKKQARLIASKLSDQHVVIISGLAYGIDAEAHQGCLEGRSATIAILGCGLDQPYPEGNAAIRKNILEQDGLVLTEHPPGDKPYGKHFPYRNRLISGLSQGLIVVEAREKSGSLTTVDHALKQGREVFVYPGDPQSDYYAGNHKLLRDGARFFTKAEDILEDMGWLDNPEEEAQNSGCANLPESPIEERLVEALKPGPLGFDQLCAQTGYTPSELNIAVTLLHLRGVLELLPGKAYRLKEETIEPEECSDASIQQ